MNFSFEGVKQTNIVDFSLFNLDSVVFSLVLGVIGCIVLWAAARKATSGVPGRFQAAVEILSEMVENQAKGVIHNANSRKLISPLALTVFVWELVKIILTVALLLVAPKVILDLSWIALVAGFVVTMKVYWLAMALGWMQRKSKPNVY